jgi:hypothetical protein
VISVDFETSALDTLDAAAQLGRGARDIARAARGVAAEVERVRRIAVAILVQRVAQFAGRASSHADRHRRGGTTLKRSASARAQLGVVDARVTEIGDIIDHTVTVVVSSGIGARLQLRRGLLYASAPRPVDTGLSARLTRATIHRRGGTRVARPRGRFGAGAAFVQAAIAVFIE